MKLLLALGDDAAGRLVSSDAKPFGFETVRYSYIPKAMDNLDEIDPSGIVISAKDFPRHWKVMTQFAGNKYPVVLLSGDELDDEEYAKARHLGVNVVEGKSLTKDAVAHITGYITDHADDHVTGHTDDHIIGRTTDQHREALQGTSARKERSTLMKRSLAFAEAAAPKKTAVSEKKPEPVLAEAGTTKDTQNSGKLGFVFNIPGDMALITGNVKEISPKGLSFRPDHTEVLKQLKAGMEFRDCSLRAGDEIISPVCRLVKSGDVLSLEFISFQNGEQKLLDRRLREFA